MRAHRLDSAWADCYESRMADFTLSMPEGLRKWAEQRVAEGRYADTDDYIRALIRQDQDEAESDTAWLQAGIDEGLASELLAEDAFAVIDTVIDEGRVRRDAA